MKKHSIVLAFYLVVGFFNIYGQADCRNALPVCFNAYNDGAVSGIGNVDDFLPSTTSDCLGAAGAETVESNSYWFRVKLVASGQFGFDIIPNDPSEDWDFAVYGPNAICGQLPLPIKCNEKNDINGGGITGVGNDLSSDDLYDSWMDVTAGDEYLILVNQFLGSNAGFNIKWTGSIYSSTSPVLDCSIQVDLGPDLTLCDNEFVFPWLSALTFSNGNNISYEWLKFNNSTNSWEAWNPLGNAAYERQVTQAGRYMVNVYIIDSSTGGVIDTLTDEIEVNMLPSPTANPLENDVYGCDDGTGYFDFDLAALDDKIKGIQTVVTVTYHEFEEFAKLGSDPQTSPYNSSGTRTIWARIENLAGCFDITSFKIIVVPTPTAYEPAPLIFCDTDADDKFLFNLEDRTDDILGGQPDLIVTYYIRQNDAELGKFEIYNPAISDPSTAPPPALFATTDAYLSRSKKIWARVEPVLGSGCFAITSFDLEVVAPASANPIANIQKCDDNNDGFYQFDFRSLDTDILGTQSASIFEVNYFATQVDADNNNIAAILPTPYTNIDAYIQETIYARIQVKNSPDCFDTTSFTIQVFDSAALAMQTNFTELAYCDDDNDGIYVFDLTEKESEVLGIYLPLFNISYFTAPDYSPSSQILNPLVYKNTVADYSPQTIYVRITNNDLTGTEQCKFDTSFNIKVLELPNASPYDLVQCGDAGNPIGTIFNLAEADFYVANGNQYTVTYHLSPIDAGSSVILNDLQKYPFSNSNGSIVYARVVASANGCYKVVEVNLKVIETAFNLTNYTIPLTECDDDGEIDGKRVWNLAQTRALIINRLSATSNPRVAYYRKEEDALSETNKIDPDFAYENETPYSQIIWVRAESTIDGSCAGIAPVIQLTVNPRPEFDLDEAAIICLNDLPKTISTFNPLGTYSYEWTNEAGIPISYQPFAEISQAGVYTVTATSNMICESFPKQITVTESVIADISSEDIQVNDNSGNNSITVNNANQNLGIGDYEFALDDISGPYQDSPIFSDVIPGKHIVYVNDKNNCGLAQITVYVFGFPNFFTPNDDGQNDTWNVLGVDSTVIKASSIYIFDRYGKLMANFSASQKGWDGFYDSNKAVSTDYWYLAKMTDLNGESMEYKGHFSLIRR